MGSLRTFRRTAGSLAVALAVGLGPPSARADADMKATEARARALAEEGAKLQAQGKLDEACPKLAASEALVPSAKTLQALAQCEESAGRLARALAAYKELAQLGGRTLRGARARTVQSHVQRLEATVPRLVVRLAPEALAAPELEVKACGAPLREGDFGIPLPEDPGACEVTARAKGTAAWTSSVELARGARKEVLVPGLQAEAPAPAPSASAEATPPTTETPPPPPEPAAPSPPPPPPAMTTERKITGVALLGLGAALVGGGTAFALAAQKNSNDSNARCPTTTCADPTGLTLNARALDDAHLADLTFVAGGVSLAAGAVVLLTRLGVTRPATALWVQPVIGSASGFAVGGAF